MNEEGVAMLFHVLGPVEAHVPGGGVVGLRARKPATVLATLLLHANQWVRVERLISATWPEQAVPASAAGNLKTYIWQLRQWLPEAVDGPRIASRPSAYRLCVGPGELDVDRAEGLATDARMALHDGHLAKAAELFTEALDLWRGEPFEGVPLEEAAGMVAWLAELRRELREGLADAFAGLGRARDAVALLRALTDEDPFREGSWARWMLVLNDAGRRGAALAVYERVRAILASELGAEPGRELREALRTVRRGERARRPNRRDLARDVPDFTGRAAEVARLVALGATGTSGVPVAVIDGMPGVGKTALAVHVAHLLAPSFPDAALQVELGSVRPAEVLDRLLRAIGLSDEDIPPDLPGRAAMWRAELAGRRTLVLLDDARGVEQVQPLLPGSPGSLVLVTTRTRTLRIAGARVVTLDPLPPAQAAELFGKVAADRRVAAGAPAVGEVVQLCGGLPAAVRAAAERLQSRPVWTIDRLAEQLRSGGGVELAPAVEQIRSALRPLPQRSHRVLSALASLPGDAGVCQVAAAAGWTAEHARSGLEYLLDRHLVGQPAAGRYRLHPLVRAAVAASSEVHCGRS